MSRRKLTKKAFAVVPAAVLPCVLEQMLNEKGEKFTALYQPMIDLTGMDDYFEIWKAQRSDAIHQTGGEGVSFPGYGTWLRRQNIINLCFNTEFDRRYQDWIETHV